MKELLARVEAEEEAFTTENGYPPRVDEFSEALQEEMRQKGVPEGFRNGSLKDFKAYLNAF